MGDEIAKDVAAFLGFDGELQTQCAEQVKRLYDMFINVDCLQLEVNPLAETPEGKIYTADAKLGFDDNASFRQKDIFDMEDTSFNLNYVQMDGNIGCLVNGAGLAMATMDILKLNGGNPANFLDVGGSATAEAVKKAFELLLREKSVRSIFVNI